MYGSEKRWEMSRRTSRVLVASLAATFAGAAWFGGAAVAQPPAATVKVWGWQANQDLWAKVQDTLNAQGQNLTIEYRAADPQQYGSILQTALTGGAGPDVFTIGASAPAPYKFQAAGLLTPLDGIIDKTGIPEQYFDYSTIDGVNYGVPFALLGIQFYYNKDIFAQHGKEPPRTWDDLIALSQYFQSQGITPIAAMGQGNYGQASTTWTAEALHGSLLGSDFIEQMVAKEKRWDDPRVVNLFARLQEITQYYQDNWEATGTSGNEMETLFATGRSAMEVSGTWDLAINFLKINPDLNVGVFLTPTMTADETQYLDWIVDGVFGLSSQIQDPAVKAAAEAVIKYTATPEFGKLWAETNQVISPIDGTELESDHPVTVQVRQWLADGVGSRDLLGTGSPFMLPPLPTGTDVQTYESVQSVCWTVLPQLMKGQMTPEEAAATFQDKLSWYYDQ